MEQGSERSLEMYDVNRLRHGGKQFRLQSFARLHKPHSPVRDTQQPHERFFPTSPALRRGPAVQPWPSVLAYVLVRSAPALGLLRSYPTPDTNGNAEESWAALATDLLELDLVRSAVDVFQQ